MQKFGASESVDIHCHCLPGIDDGPATLDESLALCRALAADGTTTVIATPHQFGRYDRRNPGQAIRGAVAALNQALAQQQIPLTVLPGADVRVDERIPALLATGEVVTLADARRHILLELPHDSYIDPLMLIRMLASRNIQSIVSHPERHPAIAKRPELVLPWLRAGGVLQITAGSLLGDFGASAEQTAWDLLGNGLVSLVATDAHDVQSRPPRMTAALEQIEHHMGHAAAQKVCLNLPQAVREGRPCPLQLPAPPRPG